MKTKDAIKVFGSKAALAKALKLTRGAISLWGETIPASRQFQLEVMTDGLLKADRSPQYREPRKAA